MDLTHLPRMDYFCDTQSLLLVIGTTVKMDENDYTEFLSNKMNLTSNTGTEVYLPANPNSFVVSVLISPFVNPTDKQQELIDRITQGISLVDIWKNIEHAPDCEKICLVHRQIDGCVQIEERQAWTNSDVIFY